MKLRLNDLSKLLVSELVVIINFLLDVISKKDDNNEFKPKYRLVDWNVKNGVGRCTLLVSSSNGVLHLEPAEIVTDSEIMSGLHPLDASTVTNLANLEESKPKLFIDSVSRENCEKSIIIKNIDGSKKEISAKELLKSRSEIERFSKEDILNIGFLIGDESCNIPQTNIIQYSLFIFHSMNEFNNSKKKEHDQEMYLFISDEMTLYFYKKSSNKNSCLEKLTFLEHSDAKRFLWVIFPFVENNKYNDIHHLSYEQLKVIEFMTGHTVL